MNLDHAEIRILHVASVRKALNVNRHLIVRKVPEVADGVGTINNELTTVTGLKGKSSC